MLEKLKGFLGLGFMLVWGLASFSLVDWFTSTSAAMQLLAFAIGAIVSGTMLGVMIIMSDQANDIAKKQEQLDLLESEYQKQKQEINSLINELMKKNSRK